MSAPLSFVDLFCGAGGWTLGLKRAGWIHKGAVDNDVHALETYQANHGSAGVVAADVKKLRIADLVAAIGTESVDAIVASPPCQGFSSAGPRRVGDPDDNLCDSVARIAKGLHAKLVVIENVAGMVSKKDSTGRRIIDNFVNKLRRFGYDDVDWKLLRAQEFGVPQTRTRLILVATRRGADTPPAKALIPDAPSQMSSKLSVRGLLQPKRSVTDDFYWMTDRKRRYYESRHAADRTRAYVRFIDRDAVASTVRANYAKSRGAEALLRYSDGSMRMLTELEIARIQSFPDTYQFIGARTHVYRQIGNAFPPLLAHRIGRHVAKVFRRKLS